MKFLFSLFIPLLLFSGLYSQLYSEQPSATSSASSIVEEKLKKYIKFSQSEPNRIGYLYVGDHEDMISQSTWLYIKKALDYYKQHPPIFIILELNTPGGEVFAAQKISDALKEIDTQFDIPVIAFINNWAISAGAMLAYSSRFITAVKDASMGAAEPVLTGTEGKLESASEKVNSAIRADFASRARFFDRNALLAEAMVDKSMILVMRDGEIVKLDSESQIRTSGADPDQVISAKDKLLTLNSEELQKYGVADLILAPKKLAPITEEEKMEGKWPLSKTLFTQIPFFESIPHATIDEYQMDWKTRFFVFLATPLISSLLLMGLVLGAYIELNSPGTLLPGVLAATCLFLIVLSYFSLEIASYLELILLVAGLILILVEIFVLPSFGIIGILGGILFLAGLLGILIPELSSFHFEYDTETVNAAGQYALKRFAWFSASLFISLVITGLLARFVLPRFKGFNRFVLAGHEQDANRGFVAGYAPSELPQVGEVGEVLASLRPAGKIVVKDRIYDAISTGGFIDSGESVKVIRLEGSDIIVIKNKLE